MTSIASHVEALTRTDSQSRRWLLSSRAQAFVLHFIDAAVLVLAVAVTVPITLLVSPTVALSPEYQWLLPLLLLAWIAGLRVIGAYSLRHVRAGATEYKRVATATAATAGLVGIVCYMVDYSLSRTLFVTLFSTGLTFLVLVRWMRRRFMARLHGQGLLLTPIVVAGSPHNIDAISSVLRREPWIGYRVIGAITREPGTHTPTGLPVLGSVRDTLDVVTGHAVEAVIFAEGSFDTPQDFRQMAWKLEEQDIQMIVVPALTDISSQRLDVRPLAGLPLVDVDRPQALEAARWIKRTFDVIGAGLLLLLVAPIMGAVALAIKVEDGGPVIFRQRRVGLKGEEFDCLKFRSMCADAEARLAALQNQNEGAGPLFKMANDPRITRVGRFIRRFSLDELPQLWNAFRGDMSLVGPRPALPAEVAQYDDYTMRRLDVRPGMTGLWQVSGRSRLSWDDTVRLDLYYVDNWSIVQDLMILAKTARAVVGSDGAY